MFAKLNLITTSKVPCGTMQVRPVFVAAFANLGYAYPPSFNFTSLTPSLDNPALINTTPIISKREFKKPHSDFNNPCGVQPDGYGPQPGRLDSPVA